MPKFPSDMEKCRRATERSRIERADLIKEGIAATKAEEEFIEAIRHSEAKKLGVDPSTVIVHVSRRGHKHG